MAFSTSPAAAAPRADLLKRMKGCTGTHSQSNGLQVVRAGRGTDLEVGVEGERGSGGVRLDGFAQLGGDGDAFADGRVRCEIILDRRHLRSVQSV